MKLLLLLVGDGVGGHFARSGESWRASSGPQAEQVKL